MNFARAIFFQVVLLTFCTATFCQQDTIPSVFMIGEYELEYESLVVECEDILLQVCDDSMEEAYEHWLLMLHDMEKFAKEEEIEIRGVKLWLNTFWNPDGTIKNIVYYPKPNCRNMDFSKLGNFFNKFVDNYAFTKTNIDCFAHYGSASFPTHTELLFNQKED